MKTSAPAQVRGKTVISRKSKRSQAMLDAVQNLQERGELCDFEVRAGSEVFPAHRLVLQISSDYFRTMLQTDMIEATQGYVEMRNMDGKAVMSCLRFIYTGEIEMELDTIHNLLNASNLMQLDEVKSTCFEYCISEMTVDNCLDILALSKQFVYDKASTDVMNFISFNLCTVADTNAFTKMDKEDLDSVMLCKTASSNATALWKAVTRWIDHDERARSRYTSSFLALLNESDLGFLFDELIAFRHVLSSDECSVFLARAIFHASKELQYFKRDFKHRLNTGNCLLIERIIDRYCHEWDSNTKVSDILFTFIAANIIEISGYPHFLLYAMGDVLRILKSEPVRRLKQQIRWETIVRWSSGQRGPVDGFSQLFEQVDLLKLSVSFIQREVLPNREIQLSHACKDMIIESMFIRAKTRESKGGRTSDHSALVARRQKK